MTRKDYVKIAAALRAARDRIDESGDRFSSRQQRYEGWLFGVYELADALQHDNPRFDRDRFYGAAGVAGFAR